MTTTTRAGRTSRRIAAAVAAGVALLGVVLAPHGDRASGLADPAPSQDGLDPALELTDQSWAVGPGGVARLELSLLDPDIVPPTTTTTTTTTSTTTTTTTTTTLPPEPAAVGPTTTIAPSEQPGTATTNPATTTTTPTTTTTTVPPPELRVQVRAHRRMESREAVEAAIAGNPGVIVDIVEFDIDDVLVTDPDNGVQRLAIDVPIAAGGADADALDLLDSGIYPVTVQVRQDSIPLAEHTTFVELVTPTSRRGPYGYSVIATVDDPGPDATTSEFERAATDVDRIADLAAQLTAPVAVVIPPGVLTSLAVRDPDRLDRLAAALTDDDVALALPVESLDPSSAAAAGIDADFLTWVDSGAAVIERLLPTVTVSRAAWPVDDRLTPQGAALLQRSGVDLFVVPFERYATWGGSLPGLTDTSLLVSGTIDDDATAHLLLTDPITALLQPGDGDAMERAIHLMAIAASTRYELGPDLRSFALTPPELGIPDVAVLRHLEQFVAEHPEVGFTTPDQIEASTNSFFINGIEFTVALDARPSQSIDDRVLAVGGTRLAIADVASMLPEADERPVQWEDKMRVALSTAVTDAAAADRIDAVTAELDELRSAVEQPEAFAFTLAGSQSEIPLRIENTSSTPLRVLVRARAEQLVFPEEDVIAVLDANATTDVSIPVTARSNGVFPVTVEVFTPAGNLLLEPVSLTARVNTLTGLGRVVTVGAALVLATWWLTYFRRRRRERLSAELEASLGRHPAANGANGAPGDHELSSDVSPDAAEAALSRGRDDTSPSTTPSGDRPGSE